MPETGRIRADRPTNWRLTRVVIASLLLTSLGVVGTDAASDRAGSLARPLVRGQSRHARMPGSDALSDDARAALAPVLEDAERIGRVSGAVGCALVLTDRRLLVVRDGAKFRPRSGVRWWSLDRDLTLRLARVRHDTSRLVIGREGRTASVFLTGTQVGDAQTLIAEIRQRTYADG